jgi:undecaprenyl-diphosphatase
MNYFDALILGIVEGLTEFLPISSTFHLIMTSKILGLASTNFLKMFEVFIQSGAIFSLVFIYLKTLLSDKKLFLNVLYSFIPTATVGLSCTKSSRTFSSDQTCLCYPCLCSIHYLFYPIKSKTLKISSP